MAAAGGTPLARKGKRWFPLESNPEVMTTYARQLGLRPGFAWHDVLAVEDWALDMVPRPVKAVVLLFPIKDVTEAHRREEAARISAEGQAVAPELYYMEQTVGNACGTVGIMHAMLNTLEETTEEDSYVRRFHVASLALGPRERAEFLEGEEDIDTMHVAAAAQGQSTHVDIDVPVLTHFVAFVVKDGHLYELDGRKGQPVNHGPSSEETLLRDAAGIIKQFMARDPEELRFTITALGPAASD